MEVLFEVNKSRKELFIVAETVADTLRENLPPNALLLPFDDDPGQAKDVYVLQRWSEKWKEWVDVKDASDIGNRDKLMAYLKKETVSL